jgi:hypothetical protein
MDNSPNSQSLPSIFSSLGALSFPKPAQSTDPSSTSLHSGRTGPFSMLTNQRITPLSNASLSSILHSKSQDAFRSAALSRPHVSALRDLGIQMNSRRRAAQQTKVGLATGYIDQDDSGNYDPGAQGAKKRAQRRAALPVTPPPKKVGRRGRSASLLGTVFLSASILRRKSHWRFCDRLRPDHTVLPAVQPRIRIPTRRTRKMKKVMICVGRLGDLNDMAR